MINQLNLNRELRFAIGGTLGDMYIVFCKIFGLRKAGFEGKISLYYSTTHPEFLPMLKELFNLVDNVVFEETIKASSGAENDKIIFDTIKKFNIPFINTTCFNFDKDMGLVEPEYIKMEPFPKLNIQSKRFDNNKFKIGIQLHSGKIPGNFKGFSLPWITQIVKLLPADRFAVYLFGTGIGYKLHQIKRMCAKYNIMDMVGRTDFLEWLAYMKSMDYFITPEGFPAFFAMSQKIKSLIFYTDYQILGRVHPDWRKENIIISAGQETFFERLKNLFCRKIFKRNQLFKPLKPTQIWSLIYSYETIK
jgi:hypothetical protein